MKHQSLKSEVGTLRNTVKYNLLINEEATILILCFTENGY